MPKVKAALCGAFSLFCASVLCRSAAAQDYPTQPIHIAVGAAAGGVADIIARLYGAKLTEKLGQTVIIDNMPSAYSLRPTELVARAEPDGYNLMLGSSDLLTLPFLKKNYRFRILSDFTPVASLASSWTVFAVNASLPVTTLKDFVALARGEQGGLRYGSGGVGTPMHIASELLEQSTGVAMVHVPYQSGAQSLTDLVSGRIEMSSMGLASAKSVEAGKIKVIAQVGETRHPLFPDVPTAIEAGYPDVHLQFWFGLFGPPKMPAPILKRLDEALASISNDEAFRKQLVQFGAAADFRDHDTFVKEIEAENERWRRLIPAMNLPALD